MAKLKPYPLISKMITHTKICKSLEETQTLAAEWVVSLRGLIPQTGAVVVGLSGDLGSGKTSFVQGVARTLGVEEHVTSPTFILERIYKLGGETSKWKYLVHIDCYRLDSAQELKNLGFEELASEPENLILIEWPERIVGALPKDIITLKFEFIDENTRKIEW